MQLTELIKEIDSRRIGTEWILPFNELTEWISLSKEKIIRILYLENSYNLTLSLNGFTQENISDLITLLQQSGFKNVSKHFHKAGYFFSHTDLDHWEAFFQSVLLSKLQNANIDEVLLCDAIKSSHDFQTAALYYCQSRFDQDQLLSFSINLYCKNNNIDTHNLSIKILKDHITDLFQRKVLRWDILFESIFENLKFRAVKLGYIKVESQDSLASLLPNDVINSPGFQNALNCLHSSANDNFEKIRIKYLRQLKASHPDIDPGGLEKTRNLIESWNILQSFKAAID